VEIHGGEFVGASGEPMQPTLSFRVIQNQKMQPKLSFPVVEQVEIHGGEFVGAASSLKACVQGSVFRTDWADNGFMPVWNQVYISLI